MSGRKRGFTLTELLVAIAIIFLLMTIAVAALGNVQKRAKDAVCLSQVRQWGLILKMYCDEYDGNFFSNQHFTQNDRLMELSELEKLRYCPRAKKSISPGGGLVFPVMAHTDTSYGVNLWIARVGSGGRDRSNCWLTTHVKRGYQIPMFMDCFYNDLCDLTPYHWDEPPEYDGQPPEGSVNEMRRVCTNRHSGTINCAFRDYSARRVGLKELWELRWNRKWFTNPSGQPDYDPPVWPEWMRHFKDYR